MEAEVCVRSRLFVEGFLPVGKLKAPHITKLKKKWKRNRGQ